MNYIEKLDLALEEAVKNCIDPFEVFGLLFSGGLDSSLLAKICIDLGKSPILISVYMEGSKDESHIKKAASYFNLELIEKTIFDDEIMGYVEEVSLAASTNNPLDISIGVPIFTALETASWAGIHTVMVGQGADELFAGYHRYLKMDVEQLEKALKKDVETINIQRDMSLAEACGVQLLLPYLDEKVIDVGLSIPAEWKIKNGVRKFALREVAKKRGLPKTIWAREKKAIQYSTGVDKIVRKVL